ncbi:MAG: hypothetical protein EWV53_14350 [Microcystis panniformis Mp_MB_F_20051200_S9]|jgi:hypothetical protein|uniref:Uncharacterized protein n=1 Tax=Microcystis panniformis Mp_MB_F_20051200_S9 TaxID=2486223 RepID=A0A552PUF9_9CHRO|nr:MULTISPECIES: hypothetical protein [unclassified Microcystis]NCR08737.1 hypothetical protein [Microcystis aeruginosa LG13-11]NCR12741.1 hypothetical protein [Microcystis aeruginosa SX13-11]NCR17987.1 hypothetical protein [Microcystis aeruginosa LL13-03]NCR43189.1 hypothetical protein [Microcystis aeruginosa SX13-01]NCR68799.1 hypothetical protein [Microcystis aeruginosa LL11-07]NCR88536.1 hypothetical protein [Microcystis aeruginosa G13-10]NCS09929.1 hypothetical protein [Microcystis aeru
MADDKNSETMFSKVISAILIALIAGGTSPWWWNKIFCPDGVLCTEGHFNLKGKTVWIHISAESQRNEAEYLLRKLNDNGAQVIAVTNLVKEGTVDSNNHNPQNQSYEKVFSEDGKILVKFFYDEDRDAAKEIKTLIGRNNIILADNTQASAKDPQGIIEVWYPWSQQ